MREQEVEAPVEWIVVTVLSVVRRPLLDYKIYIISVCGAKAIIVSYNCSHDEMQWHNYTFELKQET